MSTLISIASRLTCLILLATLVLPSPGLAHRVTVFAWVDGDTVRTTSQFSRSNKVHSGLIEVMDAATGELLVSGRTNDQGEFSFEIPPAVRTRGMDLRVALKAGEGHAGEWIVPATEYIAQNGPAPVQQPNMQTPPKSAETSGQAAASPAVTQPPSADIQAIEQAVERALDRKLAPVTRMLAEQMQAGPSATEIVGGIGWLMGLAGLGAWFAARKKK
jgi:nickel transport protein